MPSGDVRFDLDSFPIVIATYSPTFTAKSVTDLSGCFADLFARRSAFVMISDLRPIGEVPGALARKQIAEFMNGAELRAQQARYQAGSVNVIASAPMRAALTALTWLWTPPMPMVPAATMPEAIDRAVELLRARGVVVPAAIVDEARRRASASRRAAG